MKLNKFTLFLSMSLIVLMLVAVVLASLQVQKDESLDDRSKAAQGATATLSFNPSSTQFTYPSSQNPVVELILSDNGTNLDLAGLETQVIIPKNSGFAPTSVSPNQSLLINGWRYNILNLLEDASNYYIDLSILTTQTGGVRLNGPTSIATITLNIIGVVSNVTISYNANPQVTKVIDSSSVDGTPIQNLTLNTATYSVASPTPTPSITPTAAPPTITPTITPVPPSSTPTPACNRTCNNNNQCATGYVCSSGFCRNPSCTSEVSCTCPATTPTPTTAPPTITPIATATPNPTNTPIPTFTPTPTTTPPSPTPTPTPVTFTALFRLAGITQGTKDQNVLLTLVRNSTIVAQQMVPATNVYSPEYQGFSAQLQVASLPTASINSEYTLYVKSRSHLQRAIPATYFNSTTNTWNAADFATNLELLSGDVNNSNTITLHDLTSIKSLYTGFRVAVPANTPEDINDDGYITLIDLSLALLNYQSFIVTGQSW